MQCLHVVPSASLCLQPRDIDAHRTLPTSSQNALSTLIAPALSHNLNHCAVQDTPSHTTVIPQKDSSAKCQIDTVTSRSPTTACMQPNGYLMAAARMSHEAGLLSAHTHALTPQRLTLRRCVIARSEYQPMCHFSRALRSTPRELGRMERRWRLRTVCFRLRRLGCC